MLFSFQRNIIKIIGLSTEETSKYKIKQISTVIETTCLNLLKKFLHDKDHPVTSKLLINQRSTTNNNLYIAKTARTEIHNNSFILKYLRMLRDGTTDRYQHRSTKRLIELNNKIKPQKPTTSIICQTCGASNKSRTGLATHQRRNKACRTTVSIAILNCLNITKRRK